MVRSLLACCQDEDPEIRIRAIEGLKNLRSGRSVEVLADRLRDKHELPEIRQRAAATLAAIRSFGAIRELRNRHTDTEEDERIRTFISGELDQLHPSPPCSGTGSSFSGPAVRKGDVQK